MARFVIAISALYYMFRLQYWVSPLGWLRLQSCVFSVSNPVDCSLRVACCRFLQPSWILLCCAGRPFFIPCVASRPRVVRVIYGRGLVCECSALSVVPCFSHCCVEYALLNFSLLWFVTPLCCDDSILWYELDLLFGSYSRLPPSSSL